MCEGEVQCDSSDFHMMTDSNNTLESLSRMFSELCKKSMGLIVPDDYILLSASAMQTLKEKNRSNVLYNLAKGIGISKKDTNESFFPVDRMPMGLLEYAAGFFLLST